MAKATISYTAEISDLRKKLGDIKGITAASARAMVRDLNKAARAAEKAQTAQVKGTKAAAKVVDEFGSKAGLAKSSVGDLGQALGMISPELGRAAQAASAAAGGIEAIAKSAKLSGASLAVAGTALAVFAVVLSALAISYKKTTDEIERESAAKKLAHGINQSLLPGIKKLEQAQIDLKVATGELTEEQAKYLRLQIQTRSAVVEFAEAQRSQKEAINESIESTKKWQRLTESGVGPIAYLFEQGTEAVFGFNDKIAQGTTAIEELGRAELKNYKVQKQIFKDQIEALDVITAKKAAAEKAENKIRAVPGAGDRQKEIDDETAARVRAADIVSGLTEHRLSELERLKAAELKVVNDLAETEAYTLEQLFAVEREFTQRRTELQDEAWAHRQDLAEQNVADEKQRLDEIAQAEAQHLQERQKAQAALYSSFDALASTSAGALIGYANEISETNRQAAMNAFAAYKAVSIAQAVISGATGISRAFADFPYPVALGIAGLVGATTAIQVGVIASEQPSFADTPGIVSAGSRGMTASFAPGDRIIAGRDDDDLVRQMQRAGLGGGGGSSQVLVRDADRHRGRYGRDPMRPPERYNPMKLRAGRIPGRR
mgnify:CR=1 FL=1|tara:strand:+ start:2790 stop:4601 length:1812 start_codon:yes stop_codon:yes gene_type:complete